MSKHLSHQQLLQHIDGELPRWAAWQAGSHLKTCWACQVELAHLKEEIEAIVDAQSVVFGPSIPPPPKPWRRIETQLARVSAQSMPVWKKTALLAEWPLHTRLAYCGAALAVVAIGLSLWLSPQPVLAKEVLTRVAAADGGRLAITERNVARQRVRVTKTSATSTTKSAQVNSWKSSRFTYWDFDQSVGAELLARYHSNGLETALPLSPEAMAAWVRIAGSEPNATQSHNSVDVDVASNSQGRARGLERISLHVKADHWHLDQMTLSFSDAVYRISEEDSVVIAREDVPREVMARLDPPTPPLQPAEHSPAVARPVDLNDLELSVRSELHRIRADLGEPIQIVTEPPDRIHVQVRQVTSEMKETLIASLQHMPRVQLEFQSSGSAANRPGLTRIIPQASDSHAPLDPHLLEYFGSVEAQENYTHNLFDTSNSLLAHLYALRELAERWNEDQEQLLSPGAKSTLQSMARDHVAAVQEASSGMSKQLAPLLNHFGFPVTEPAASSSGVSWRDAGATLQAALTADQILRSLLTSSGSPVSVEQALPRLRESLRNLQNATLLP